MERAGESRIRNWKSPGVCGVLAGNAGRMTGQVLLPFCQSAVAVPEIIRKKREQQIENRKERVYIIYSYFVNVPSMNGAGRPEPGTESNIR